MNAGAADWEPTIGPGQPEDFWVPEAIPAATAIIVRDSPGTARSGLQVLLLRRDPGLRFAGNMWVFPGGRIDAGDRSEHAATSTGDAGGDPARADDEAGTGYPATAAHRRALEEASRRTAARETAEEAGLAIDPADLIRWSHWTAPPGTSRRFTTAFYLTTVTSEDDAVTIDDAEIREYRWAAPGDVLRQHARGELGLTPPTFITLVQLLGITDGRELVGAASEQPLEHFSSRFGFLGDLAVALYHGDAGYDRSDAGATGPRHRLSLGTTWTYERDG